MIKEIQAKTILSTNKHPGSWLGNKIVHNWQGSAKFLRRLNFLEGIRCK